eukprot:Amastigsp_a1627_136.p3 type:complete len:106 gc:universal Amastigsp_a1627_136:1586-1269(-)
MKSAWKAAMRSTTDSIFDSGGRNVVRKCHVPSAWPKPEPGTTQTPVFSRSSRQYIVSGTSPSSAARAMALGGRVTLGKQYMAPWASLHETPSRRLRPATSALARR